MEAHPPGLIIFPLIRPIKLSVQISPDLKDLVTDSSDLKSLTLQARMDFHLGITNPV